MGTVLLSQALAWEQLVEGVSLSLPFSSGLVNCKSPLEVSLPPFAGDQEGCGSPLMGYQTSSVYLECCRGHQVHFQVRTVALFS